MNYGKNKKLMEQCQTLKDYAMYVAKVRKYAETMSTAEAVEQAVRESIKENILAEFLRRYRAEAIQMSILEYDEERELRLIRKEEYEIGKEAGIAVGKAEGREEGRAEGREEGKAVAFIVMVRKMLTRGMKPEEISDILALDLDMIHQAAELIAGNDDLNDSEIACKLLEISPEIL